MNEINQNMKLILIASTIALISTATYFFIGIWQNNILEEEYPSILVTNTKDRPVIMDADGAQWIVHSKQAKSNKTIRIPRYTNIDNHPYGRAVYWPSIHSWFLRFCAMIYEALFNGEKHDSIEQISCISNLLYAAMFSIPIATISVISIGKFGLFVYPILLVFLFSFNRFGLRSPDHHMLQVLVFLVFVLQLIRSLKTNTERNWILSGISIGFLFWISPISGGIVYFIATIMVLIIHPFGRPTKHNLILFSYVVSIIIVIAYFADYYPDISIHIEACHPVWMVPVLICPVFISQIQTCIHEKFALKSIFQYKIIGNLFLITLCLLLFIANMEQWYTPSSPIMKRWLYFIGESAPFRFERFTSDSILLMFIILVSIYGSLSILMSKKAIERIFVIICLMIIAGLAPFCFIQIRMTDFLYPIFAVLGSVLCVSKEHFAISRFYIILFVTYVFQSVGWTMHNYKKTQAISADDGIYSMYAYSYNIALYADAIRKLDNLQIKSILAQPADSVYLNYYTEYPVFGSYYWENTEGMKRALSLMSYYCRTTDEKTMTHAFLSAAKVGVILVSKAGLHPSFPYILHGKNLLPIEGMFFDYLSSVETGLLPAWLNLVYESEYVRVFRVDPMNSAELQNIIGSRIEPRATASYDL